MAGSLREHEVEKTRLTSRIRGTDDIQKGDSVIRGSRRGERAKMEERRFECGAGPEGRDVFHLQKNETIYDLTRSRFRREGGAGIP